MIRSVREPGWQRMRTNSLIGKTWLVTAILRTGTGYFPKDQKIPIVQRKDKLAERMKKAGIIWENDYTKRIIMAIIYQD